MNKFLNVDEDKEFIFLEVKKLLIKNLNSILSTYFDDYKTIEGYWRYVPTEINTYYDLLVNSRLGKFVYTIKNSESKVYFYITKDKRVVLDDQIQIGSKQLPNVVGYVNDETFNVLKTYILITPRISDLEDFLNDKTDIDQNIYGSMCNKDTINSIKTVEQNLISNQITIYDMKDFYEKCYQVRNFKTKEVLWTFRLKLDDGKGNLLKTTYINVFFIGKTSKRIVVVYKDLVLDKGYTLNIEVSNFVESLSKQWKEIYEL